MKDKKLLTVRFAPQGEFPIGPLRIDSDSGAVMVHCGLRGGIGHILGLRFGTMQDVMLPKINGDHTDVPSIQSRTRSGAPIRCDASSGNPSHYRARLSMNQGKNSSKI